MHAVILLEASFESLINFDFPEDNTKTNFKLGQIKTIVFLIRKILNIISCVWFCRSKNLGDCN